MLKRIKILNFKWIKEKEILFTENFNVIVWNNWCWKTNILQAISHIFFDDFSWNNKKNLVYSWENNLYLEWDFLLKDTQNTIWVSFDLSLNKQNILLNKKKQTKKVLFENLLKVCHFLPIDMNLFYLWPKYRRDFLDNILKNSFLEYSKLLSEYEKVLKNRNKILKNILEWNSKKDEIYFWNDKFIILSKQILIFRLDLVKFFSENIIKNFEIFSWKINKIEFIYNSKIDLDNIETSIKDYLEKNFDRDIILWKTHIWPHIDDFDILIDGTSIIDYASRWEMKSIIICLKLLELSYINEKTWKKTIFLIDDLSSELDENHIKFLLDKIANIQTIITSISEINWLKANYIYL